MINIGYADGIALLSSTTEGVQRLINSFCKYCQEHGLVVNPSKCEAMVFAVGNAWQNQRTWTLPAAGQGDRQPRGLEVRGAARHAPERQAAAVTCRDHSQPRLRLRCLQS